MPIYISHTLAPSFNPQLSAYPPRFKEKHWGSSPRRQRYMSVYSRNSKSNDIPNHSIQFSDHPIKYHKLASKYGRREKTQAGRSSKQIKEKSHLEEHCNAHKRRNNATHHLNDANSKPVSCALGLCTDTASNRIANSPGRT